MPIRPRYFVGRGEYAAVVCCWVWLVPMASTELTSVKDIEFDLTNSETAVKQLRWNDASTVKVTEKGLYWDGPSDRRRDVRIESINPIAVGWSWRTVSWVGITVHVDSIGPIDFYSAARDAAHASLLLRYSCDRKNWTDWAPLDPQAAGASAKSPSRIAGTIDVPKAEFEAYQALITRYTHLDVPWPSDEEAAAKWILQQDPKYFERHKPFVGYLQFAVATRLAGSTPIRSISVHIVCQAGGMHMPPKDKSTYEGRMELPWRFTADKYENAPATTIGKK